jgi:hypothetical protein
MLKQSTADLSSSGYAGALARRSRLFHAMPKAPVAAANDFLDLSRWTRPVVHQYLFAGTQRVGARFLRNGPNLVGADKRHGQNQHGPSEADDAAV